MPAGRPLKFETVEKLQEKIDAYFSECDSRETEVLTKSGIMVKVPNPRPYTITGLALALDTTRETLLDYEEKEKYSDTIKRAKMKCQNYAEEYLFSGSRETGAIFNLKNNYGWKDKTEQDITSGNKPISILGGVTQKDVSSDNSDKKDNINEQTDPGSSGGNISQQDDIDSLIPDRPSTE